MSLAPVTEAEMAAIIRMTDNPLSIRGGGTRGFPERGDVLETSGLGGIKLYEPGALTMVAGAGTPLTEVEAALEAEGQMLAFEPFRMATNAPSTIGGVFSTNACGSRRMQVGAARDFLLGVRFVDGLGNVVKNGGRVMKNVTGYDLVKLMAGAHGTLGVLSEVSFKVLPKPETTGTLQITGLDDAAALGAMTTAMNAPYDVSGAVHLARKDRQDARTLIRVEGFEGSVRHRLDRLKALLGAFGAIAEIEPGLWDGFGRLNFFKEKPAALWKVAIRPSVAAQLSNAVARRHDIDCAYDWAGGRIWIGAGENADHAGLHHALQENAANLNAHASLMDSPMSLDVPRFQPEGPAVGALSRGLRQRFDPKGNLNPGVMG